MKNLLHCFTIILLALSFTACQKELNFENISGNGQAVGTLKSSSGICLPGFVFGNYTKDSVLKATDILEIYADITTIGTYQIKTDTVAGFYFIGTGTITKTGVNIIHLTGSGTPTSSGPITFTIKFGNSICKIDVYVNSGTPPPTAFTFTCAGTTFGIGVYTAGTIVGTQHTVTLSVAVTSTGPYSINIAAINGISFSGSGIFATTGFSQVTLLIV